MDLNTGLERLRGFFYEQTPSKESWEALGALFEAWPADKGLSEGLDYAEPHLEAWTGEARPAVATWGSPLRRVSIPQAIAMARGADEPVWWPLVRCLQIHDGRFDEGVLTRFVHESRLNHLTHLYLTQCKPPERLLDAIVSSPSLTGLTHLALYSSRVSFEEIDALLKSPLAARLEHLGLGSCSLDEGSIWHLAETKALPKLKSLSLSFNALDEDNVDALVKSPWMPSLAFLSLQSLKNRSIDYKFHELGESNGLPHMGRASHAGSLQWLQKPKLKKLCKARGLKGYSKLSRGDLVMKLIDAWSPPEAA